MNPTSIRRGLCVLLCTGWMADLARAESPRTPRVHALVGARVVLQPGKVLDPATVVVRDGVIVAVGDKLVPPADARRWDLRGRTVYPGLIEPYWKLAAPETPGSPARRRGRRERAAASATAPEPAKRGATHENPRVHPEQDAAESLALTTEELEAMRAAGFAVAHLVPPSGVFRGRSTVVSLRDGPPDRQVLELRHAHVLAFEHDTGSGRPSTYPGSIMGAVALVRQTLLDAGWERRAESVYGAAARAGLERPQRNASLLVLSSALPQYGGEPVWIETGDVLGTLRSAALAREFGLAAVLVGAGDEYRYLDAVRATGYPLVIPADFPAPPHVEDEDESQDVDLQELRHWQLAPDNPRRLLEAGVPFAFTSEGLGRRSLWRSRLRTAIERGLSPDAALAAFTTVPARLLGAERQLGSIEPGKVADFTITDGDLFAENTSVIEVWVDGDRHEVRDRKRDDPERVRGDWRLVTGSGAETQEWTLHVRGGDWALEAEIEGPSVRMTASDVAWKQGELRVVLAEGRETVVLEPKRRKLLGTWTRADGMRIAVQGMRREKKGATRPEGVEDFEAGQDSAAGRAPEAGLALDAGSEVAASPESTREKAGETRLQLGPDWPPRPQPAPRAVLVRDATLWTCGPQGKLENADLLAVGGKITTVGQNLTAPPGAQVIDARGMHLTPGLIDAHSHSDIVGGVNEATNNCTAEVRIADVINSESIAIYRELAGGLTAANELHGSANAIGGQNAVIKLRWGSPPQGLLFEGAPPGIKFALGENPKQSNWGNEGNGRYPQTRMGVEQSIRERFMAARDDMRRWAEYAKRKDKKGVLPPRRDLQLEALAEILRGERHVHSHAYRQDEILMLVRLADEFGFRVATFDHVLEGYKVADEMAAHGAGGTCFSDWWAYKFEVYDAIPYNGALMRDRGVVVSFNSDSAELARHLNLEAAKAVKYGGVPEEEALEFVTLNPAEQLGIAARVGSLEAGKDADFVLWSQSPLSNFTRCEQTWIEGRRYFDRQADLAARGAMQEERQKLVAAARKARENLKEEDKDTGAGSTWRPSYFEDSEDASCHEAGEVQP